jgi:N-acetylneuraminic acid mutarotase
MVYDSAHGKVIMFGGQDSAGNKNDTWSYDPTTNHWTSLNPSGQLPAARVFHSMVFDPVSGKVILFGGFGGAPNFLSDTWAYDPTVNTWTELHPAGSAPPARDLSAMAYDPPTAKVFLFGGLGAGGDMNDTWAYDPAANSWTHLNPSGLIPSARRGHAMVYIYVQNGGKMVEFGGVEGSSPDEQELNDTEEYDSTPSIWEDLQPPSPVPPARDSHTMVVGGSSGEVILFGGIGSAGTPFADTWAYTP